MIGATSPDTSYILPSVAPDSGSSLFDRLIERTQNQNRIVKCSDKSAVDQSVNFTLLKRCNSCVHVRSYPFHEPTESAINRSYKMLYQDQIRANEHLNEQIKGLKIAVQEHQIERARIVNEYEEVIAKLMRLHYWRSNQVQSEQKCSETHFPTTAPTILNFSKNFTGNDTERSTGCSRPSLHSIDQSAANNQQSGDEKSVLQTQLFVCFNCGQVNLLSVPKSLSCGQTEASRKPQFRQETRYSTK